MQAGAAELRILADISDMRQKMAQVEQLMNRTTRAVESSFGAMVGRLVTTLGPLAAAFLSTQQGLQSLLTTVNGLDAFNDAADATGATIEQLSRLERIARLNGGSLDTVTSAIVKFNGALSAADGKNGTSVALKAIGLDAEQLKRIDPAAALNQVAEALSYFEDNGNKARVTQELFGKSLREVAPLLKDIADNGNAVGRITREQADQAERLNKQIAYLQTVFNDFGRDITSLVLPPLTDLVARFVMASEGAGNFGERLAMLFSVNRFSSVASAMKEARSEVDKLQARLDSVAANKLLSGRNGELLRESISEELAVAERRLDYLRKVQQMDALAGGAGNSDARDLRLQQKGSIDLESVKRHLELQEKLRKVEEDRLKIEREQLANRDLRRMAEYDKAEEEATAAIAKAKLELGESINKAIDASLKEAAVAEQTVEALELESQTIGLNRAALAELTAARLRAAAADKELQAVAANDHALLRQAIALRRQAELIVANEAKRANLEASEDAKEQWTKTFEEVGSALAEEIMRGGKSAGQLLKGYFKSLVLQPIIKAVVNPIAGAMTGALGLGASSAQAGQGASALSSLGSLAQAVSLGGAFAGSFATGFSSTLASGFATTGLALEGGLAMVAEGTMASMTAGFGQIAGALGPYALAALAVYSLYRSLDNSGTPHIGGSAVSDGISTRAGTDREAGRFLYGFGNNEGKVQPVEDAMRALVTGAAGTLNALSQAFDTNARKFTVAAGIVADNTDNALAGIRITVDGVATVMRDIEALPKSMEEALPKFTSMLASELREVVLAMSLPEYARRQFEVLGDSATIEQFAQAAQTVAAIGSASRQMRDAFAALPGSFTKIAALSDELRVKLAELFGGFQGAASAIETYYQAFYDEPERIRLTTAQLTKSLADLGLSLPPTRQSFRDLVDAQDLTTEAGRKTYAALIGLSGAFAQIAPEIESATQSLQGLADAVASISSRVLAAAQKVDDIVLQREIERVNSINRRADEFAGIAKSLRDAVAIRLRGEQGVFEDLLRQALGGDQQAMRDLPEAARAAYEAQKLQASSGFEAERAQQRIVNDLRRAAELAEAEARKRAELPPVEDPLVVAMRELKAATSELSNTIPVKLLAGFDAIDSTLDGLITEREFKSAFASAATESTLAAMFAALDANGDGTITRLEAIKANTLGLTESIKAAASGTLSDKAGLYNALRETGLTDADIRATVEGAVGPQTNADWTLLRDIAEGYRLRREAELDVKAVIDLVEDQTALPESLRLALVNGVSLIDVTVKAALESNVSPEIKRILVDEQGQYNSLIKAALEAGMPDELLRVIVDQGGVYAALVTAALGESDADAKALALAKGSSLIREVGAILGAVDTAADFYAKLKSSSVDRTITGKVDLEGLTAEQKKYLGLVSGSTESTLKLTGAVTFDPSAGLLSIFTNISRTNEILIRAQQLFVEQLLGITSSAAYNLVTGSQSTYTPNSAGYTGTYTLQASATDHLKTISTYFANLTAGVTSMAVRNATWDTYLDAIRTNTSNTSTHAFNAADTLIKIANKTFKPQVVFDRGGAAASGNVYAKGGVFTNGIVDSPTMFPESMMGEAGPEAIMPLATMPDGSLGVRSFAPSISSPVVVDNSDLRAEFQELRLAMYSIAKHSQQTAQQLRRWDDGDRMKVSADQDAGETLRVQVVQ